MRWLGRWLFRLFAAFGFVAFAALAVVAVLGWRIAASFDERAVDLPERFVLVADWRGGVPEKRRGFGPFDGFGFGGGPSLPETLMALDEAADDPRVQGLVVRTDGTGFGFGQAYELRAMVRRLADAGKFTAIYADTLGELEGGMVGTYLAAAFEHVQLQPLGSLGLTGLSSEQLYLKRLLDELDVGVQSVQREDAKSALEALTRTGPSPAAAATMDRLLDGLFAELATGIAEARGLDRSEVLRAVDQGPLLGAEARERGLIDAIGHLPALWDVVEADIGEDAERVDLAGYVGSTSAGDATPGRVVGFVHAVGPIVRGASDDPLDAPEITGDGVAEAIDAATDAEVDALLLRVSSPGGSAVASETIAGAVRRAKAAGIPVVVSMGDVAASGGYWISMDADWILAAPTTLTGSIGVIAGKPHVEALLRRVGIDIAIERRGANAGFTSTLDPWDATALGRLDVLIDDLYQSFLEGVASGRDLEVDAVRAVAGGEVWLGGEALEHDLIDQLGGFTAALDVARERAGAGADEPVVLQTFPRAQPPLAFALERLDRFLQLSANIEEGWLALTAPADLRFEARDLPTAR